MRYISIFIIFLAGTAAAIDSTATKPLDALNGNGILAVADGSTVFEFHKNGEFHSFPIPYSGRCIDGQWVSDEVSPWAFIAVGQLSWTGNPEDKYDDFLVHLELSPGHLVPIDFTPSRPIQYTNIFKCYFIVRELRPISEKDAQQVVPGYRRQSAPQPEP